MLSGTAIVVLFVIYLVFFSVMVFGGMSIESNKMVGRLYRYWISLFNKPVLRMLPTIMFFFSIIQTFISIDSSLIIKPYLSLKYPQVYEWVFGLLMAVEIVSFLIIVFKKPGESDFFNANEYCEETKKYYKRYQFYSYVFRKPICKNNVIPYVCYKISFIAKGLLYSFIAFRCIADYIAALGAAGNIVKQQPPTGLDLVEIIVYHFQRNDIVTLGFVITVVVQSVLEIVELFVFYKLGQTRASFELRAESLKKGNPGKKDKKSVKEYINIKRSKSKKKNN